MFKKLPSGLMSNRPSRFSSDQDYALLHSTGTRQPLPALATESESDSDDQTNMSVRSAEVNCLLDETAMGVEHLMSLCEDELDQALRQVQEEGSELARQPATSLDSSQGRRSHPFQPRVGHAAHAQRLGIFGP